MLLVVPSRRRLVAHNEAAFPGLARLRRSTLTGRLLAVVIGLAVIVPVGATGRLGRGLMLVPAVFAAVQVLGVLIGDVVARRDARTPGIAGLEVRRARDFLPRRLVRLVSLAAGALAVLLAWATAVGSPDDLGRAGRSLTYVCTEACTSEGLGPWPGSYYSVPITVALLLVVLFAGLAVWVTVRRPRNGADPEVVRVDDVVRRRSVESVVSSVGIAVCGSLAGVGVIAGAPLATSGANHAPVALQVAGWVVLAAGLSSLVLLVWCVVVLLLPGAGMDAGGRPVRESEPGGTAGAAGVSAGPGCEQALP
jgi:hypothetical protein